MKQYSCNVWVYNAELGVALDSKQIIIIVTVTVIIGLL